VILLDTDVIIDVLRKHPPAVAWATSVRQEEVVLPGTAVMELVQGCRSGGQLEILNKALERYRCLWPSEIECQSALELLTLFHLSDALTITDALIAQTAIAHGLPLHSFNVKHSRKIPLLQLVQPYVR
jgi:predicted nucleic acid-binding protein